MKQELQAYKDSIGEWGIHFSSRKDWKRIEGAGTWENGGSGFGMMVRSIPARK